ncbi:hypothetical protein BKA69DRAFT_1169362 [Paraphysoderma sedebokerense]|nr:hypothetical protein BKA69DRAFT_1169362 [Paraphysoderma sedebokerense]
MRIKSILIIFALLALTSVVSARPVEAIADAGPGESVAVINDNGRITTNRGGSGQDTRRGDALKEEAEPAGKMHSTMISLMTPSEVSAEISTEEKRTKCTKNPFSVRA